MNSIDRTSAREFAEVARTHQGDLLLEVWDDVYGDGQPISVVKHVLEADIDHTGDLGGDPGDIVVSLPADSRAFPPDQMVTFVRAEPGLFRMLEGDFQ